jgi:sugar phosphate isomerase/epimerase
MYVAHILKPRCILFHTGFSAHHYQGHLEHRFRKSVDTWKWAGEYAENLELNLAGENLFDTNLSVLKKLISSVPHPLLGICLNAGYLNVFSEVSVEEWFNKLGDKIFETHLHDNNGEYDERNWIGTGTIIFRKFFKLLWRDGMGPVLTIEACNPKSVKESIDY